jgi:predicted neutral ceramidase superfamily lipid hydrolase
MELDELKNRARKGELPGWGFRGTSQSPQAMSSFIDTIKEEDRRARVQMRRAMILAAVAAVFYVLLFTLTWIAPPDDSPNRHRLLLSAFGLLFLSAALVSRKRSDTLAGIDYTQPISAFLKDAECRYKPFNIRDTVLGVLYLMAFCVTGALAWLNAKNRYFPGMDQGTALLLFGIIIAAALAVGLVAGIRQWRNRNAPLLRQIREMLADLEAVGTEPEGKEPG